MDKLQRRRFNATKNELSGVTELARNSEHFIAEIKVSIRPIDMQKVFAVKCGKCNTWHEFEKFKHHRFFKKEMERRKVKI